jgi:hypothetical protein
LPSNAAPAPISADQHKGIAVDLFNLAWTLMRRPDRTAAETDTLIHAAHASRHHWGEAAGSTPANLARGEWQCSRVYAVLGRAEPALWHARRVLEICEANGIGDWDLAFAYEALARASRVAGDEDGVTLWLARARQAGEQILEAEDRDLLFSDLATI